MIREPTTTPSFPLISWPLACLGKISCASPVTSRGYRIPNRTVVAIVMSTAVIRFFFMVFSMSVLNQSVLNQFDASDEHVNQLDADKRDHQSAKSIHQQVLPQQGFGAHCFVRDPTQRQRNQGHDDERVKNNGGKYCRLRRLQPHNVQSIQHRKRSSEHRRNDRKVL